MKHYIDEIHSQKDDLIFSKNTGKKYIHEDDVEDRTSVLYRFFNFFKVYSLKKIIRTENRNLGNSTPSPKN
jgi:hypothetical protein